MEDPTCENEDIENRCIKARTTRRKSLIWLVVCEKTMDSVVCMCENDIFATGLVGEFNERVVVGGGDDGLTVKGGGGAARDTTTKQEM